MSSVPPASQSWPLPETGPTTLIVYCCLDPHNVPSTDELSDVALRWMADNIPMPQHDIIAMWFRMPMTGIGVLSKGQLPQNILHRHLVMTDPLSQEMIQYATHAIMIKSEGPCVSSSTGLWPCVAAGYGCLLRYGGVMVDVDMSAKIQPRPILDMMTEYLVPRAAMFVRPVHVEDRGRIKIIVHGMLHFGLPELAIEDVPRVLGDPCDRGLMGVAQIVGRQALLLKAQGERPTSTLEFPTDLSVTSQDVQTAYGLPADGTASSIDVRLELEPDGDPDNIVIKVRPPRHRANDFVGWINEFAAAFAPPPPSTASHLYHDEAMEEAHRRAVAELPYARQRFHSGEIAPGMTLVKYAFRVNEHQSEYMWLAVREWGKMITGELINQPVQRRDLKMGQVVTIDSADVYDWVVAGPNGPEGGYTDHVRAQAPTPRPAPNPPPRDIIPEYVKRRSETGFAGRVAEAGRQYIAAEQLPKWRMVRDHTTRQLTCAGILFAVAAIFGVATIYWLAVILALIGAFILARNWTLHIRTGGMQIGMEDVHQRGEFRIAMPIMTNMSLREPGPRGAPGLVLIMPPDGDPIQIYDAVVQGMSRIDPEDKAVVRMLRDERHIPTHRFVVPPKWTGGVEVVGACLFIERSSMASGVIDSPFFPVLYGPGSKGGVATLPLKIVWDCLSSRSP